MGASNTFPHLLSSEFFLDKSNLVYYCSFPRGNSDTKLSQRIHNCFGDDIPLCYCNLINTSTLRSEILFTIKTTVFL
jgi:hypothetical protein